MEVIAAIPGGPRPSDVKGSADRNPDEIARTVKLLAADAAIRESLTREGDGEIPVSPAVVRRLPPAVAAESPGSELGPIKRSRGRPRKHPLPDTPIPKRPRGRPKKAPVTQSSPVQTVPVPIPGIATTTRTMAVGMPSTTFLTSTHAQQMAAAVCLLKPPAGPSGVGVVSEWPKTVAVTSLETERTLTPPSIPITLPIAFLPQVVEGGAGQGMLLVAEPAFQLVQPEEPPLSVVVHPNGKEKEGERMGTSQKTNARAQSKQLHGRKGGEGMVPEPVAMAISLPKAAETALPLTGQLTPTKRPRGRPRKNPLPGILTETDPTQSPVGVGSQSPSRTPDKRPRGRPKKPPLGPALPTTDAMEKKTMEDSNTARGIKRKSAPEQEVADQLTPSPVKKPRGRPPKKGLLTHPPAAPTSSPLPDSKQNNSSLQTPSPAKRPRGRPRKHPLPTPPPADTKASAAATVSAENGTPQPVKLPTRGRPKKQPHPTSSLPSQSEGESIPSGGGVSSTPPKRPRGRPKLVATASPATAGQEGDGTASTPTQEKKRRGRGRPPKKPRPASGSGSGGRLQTGQTGAVGVAKRGRPRKNPLPKTDTKAVEHPGTSRMERLPPRPSIISQGSEHRAEHWSSSEGYHTSSTIDPAALPKPEGAKASMEASSEGGLQLAVTFSDTSSESEGEERAKMLTALAKRVCDGERVDGASEEEVDVGKYSPPLEPRFEESFDDDSSCSDHSRQ